MLGSQFATQKIFIYTHSLASIFLWEWFIQKEPNSLSATMDDHEIEATHVAIFFFLLPTFWFKGSVLKRQTQNIILIHCSHKYKLYMWRHSQIKWATQFLITPFLLVFVQYLHTLRFINLRTYYKGGKIQNYKWR